MKKTLATLGFVGAFTLMLTGCVPVANQDRGSGAGSLPDVVYDTQRVELFRNADNIPNIAYFCAGGFGWASTLSNDGTAAPALVRFESYDSTCRDLPSSPEVPLEEIESSVDQPNG